MIVSDSGDNPTGGSAGDNTYFLKLFWTMARTNGRKVLFSTIFDPVACEMLMRYGEGAQVDFMLGVGMDEHSSPEDQRGVLKAKGNHQGVMNKRNSTDYGNSALVTFGDYTVRVTDIRDSLMYNVKRKRPRSLSANTM